MVRAYWQQLLACNALVDISHAILCAYCTSSRCHTYACSERADSLPVWYYTKYKHQKYGKGCMTFWPFFGGARTKGCVMVKDAPQLQQIVDESDNVKIEWFEFPAADYALRLCWVIVMPPGKACSVFEMYVCHSFITSLKRSSTTLMWKDAATTSWACHADNT